MGHKNFSDVYYRTTGHLLIFDIVELLVIKPIYSIFLYVRVNS